jgi:hypothetical protein
MSALPSPAGPPAHPASAVPERDLPPVTEVAVATLTLIVIGGIYLAAKMPGHVTLAFPIVLLALAAALLLLNIAMLSRARDFAWRRFSQVARWGLLAYVVIAGMLEYAFVYDGVSGGTLVVLSGMLLVFGINVPLILAFTVARYADPEA